MATHAQPDQGPGSATHPDSASQQSHQRGVSLYTRVVAVNTAILLAAALALALTPVTVSFALAAEQAVILAVGVVVMLLADAALLRISFRSLDGLVARMATLDLLQPRERLEEVGGRETRALISGFNAMLERLEAERLASARRTLSALEGERRRIGQELHDEVGQRLTGTLLHLGRLVDEAPEPLRSRLIAVQDAERATLDEVGALAWQLRPGILDDLGLLAALDSLVCAYREAGEDRIRASFPRSLDFSFGPEVELAIYRIAQEALTNAVRHSAARRIELSLMADGRELHLSVVDDGRGLPGVVVEGPGVRGMRERALSVGGRLDIESSVDRGVRATFVLSGANVATWE